MKTKTRITLIIVLIMVCTIGYFASANLIQETMLRNEVQEISKLDIAKDEINMEIKTKGSYAVIEKTIKEYMNTYSTTYKEVMAILEDEQIAEILSAENYKNDGPDFIKTKEYIETTRKKFNEIITLLIDMTNEETIKEAIKDKKMNENFKDLYNELMLGDELKTDLQETKASLEESNNTINNILDIQENVIDMLIQNKNKWKVDGNQIVFSSQTLVNQYNEFINGL